MNQRFQSGAGLWSRSILTHPPPFPPWPVSLPQNAILRSLRACCGSSSPTPSRSSMTRSWRRSWRQASRPVPGAAPPGAPRQLPASPFTQRPPRAAWQQCRPSPCCPIGLGVGLGLAAAKPPQRRAALGWAHLYSTHCRSWRRGIGGSLASNWAAAACAAAFAKSSAYFHPRFKSRSAALCWCGACPPLWRAAADPSNFEF